MKTTESDLADLTRCGGRTDLLAQAVRNLLIDKGLINRDRLADLRAEIITHFEAAHITVTWQARGAGHHGRGRGPGCGYHGDARGGPDLPPFAGYCIGYIT